MSRSDRVVVILLVIGALGVALILFALPWLEPLAQRLTR